MHGKNKYNRHIAFPQTSGLTEYSCDVCDNVVGSYCFLKMLASIVAKPFQWGGEGALFKSEREGR